MIFDTHVHYDDSAFDDDREILLGKLADAGIDGVVNISSDFQSIENTLKLIKQYPFIYGAVGIHPSSTEELNEETYEKLRTAAASERVVAIGEIGLDYYWPSPAHEIQKKWFLRQLQLAKECSLPVVIHSRDAAQDTLDIMKDAHASGIGGVIHCFSYGAELAREYLNMGFFLGIGGVVTFTNGKKLKEVVETSPLEQLVLETDCPYLAPVPERGKRNSSLNLPYVISEISHIKNIPEETVIRVTRENANRLYHLKERNN